ncbi:hypothetical protein G7054_g3979 [Neopestalotiopsis clavispora]|jgi:Delta6-protoilludene synthase|nr:hypothetical protein G7054_g3979 [Neopestalotiopsis clavispora]
MAVVTPNLDTLAFDAFLYDRHEPRHHSTSECLSKEQKQSNAPHGDFFTASLRSAGIELKETWPDATELGNTVHPDCDGGKENDYECVYPARITIPDFMAPLVRNKEGWPWVARPHPESDSIKAEAADWLRGFAATGLLPEKLVVQLLAGSFADIGCLIYGHMDRAACLLAAQVMILFFAIEVATDGGTKPEQVASIAAHLKLALSCPDVAADEYIVPVPDLATPAGGITTAPTAAVDDDHPLQGGLVAMATDIAKKYAEIGTKVSAALFAHHFGAYLDGVILEAQLWDGPVLGWTEYSELREKTIGVLPGLALLFMHEDRISPRFVPWGDPRGEAADELSALSIKILINQNDLYSFNKEQARGEDAHNGVRVLMEEDASLGVQDAMDRLGDETARLAARLVEAYDRVTNTPRGSEGDGGVWMLRTLAEGCVAWIVGMDHWYTHITSRYGTRRLGEDRSLALLPKSDELKAGSP